MEDPVLIDIEDSLKNATKALFYSKPHVVSVFLNLTFYQTSFKHSTLSSTKIYPLIHLKPIEALHRTEHTDLFNFYTKTVNAITPSG